MVETPGLGEEMCLWHWEAGVWVPSSAESFLGLFDERHGGMNGRGEEERESQQCPSS